MGANTYQPLTHMARTLYLKLGSAFFLRIAKSYTVVSQALRLSIMRGVNEKHSEFKYVLQRLYFQLKIAIVHHSYTALYSLYLRLVRLFFTKRKKNFLTIRQALRLDVMQGNLLSMARTLYSKLGSAFFLRNGKSCTDSTVTEYRIKKAEDSSRIINNQGTCFAGINYGRGGVR